MRSAERLDVIRHEVRFALRRMRMEPSFVAFAALLAALGMYAVLSYTVSQRAREIGIRMALGESASRVRRRVVSRLLLLAGAGIVTGGTVALAGARLIGSLLYGVEPTDVGTFAGTAGVLLLAAAVSGYLPARRASAIDPIIALRSS